MSPANQRDILTDLRMAENVQRSLPDFLSIVADMKLVVIEKGVSVPDFNAIYAIVDPENAPVEDTPNLKGYFLANMPQTMSEKVFTWWELESRGYTQEVARAKVFTHDEVVEKFVESEYNEWDNKKFVAIPTSIIVGYRQNSVPFISRFVDPILRESEATFGNKRLTLTKDEIEQYH